MIGSYLSARGDNHSFGTMLLSSLAVKPLQFRCLDEDGSIADQEKTNQPQDLNGDEGPLIN
jgi:hypothetical protein